MLNNKDKRNAFWNTVGFVYCSVLSFINFTLNIKSFSTEEFGLFILVSSIFGVGSNLDFGFGLSTIKFVAEAKKRNDYKSILEIYNSFFVFYFVVGILIVVFFFLYYHYFLSEYVSSNNLYDPNKIRIIFIMLTASFFLRYLSNFFSNVFEGYGKFIFMNKMLILISTVHTMLVILIFVLKLELIYLAIFTLITSVFFFGLFSIGSLVLLEYIKLSFSNFNFKLIKNTSFYGLNLQLSFIVNSFIDPVIKFMIGSYLSIGYVTYFETSKKIIDLTSGLIFSVQRGLFNKLSEHHALGTLKEFVNESLFGYSKMSNNYSIVIYGILNPFFCGFMYLWFNSFETMIILLIFFLPFSLINFGGPAHKVLMIEGNGLILLLIQIINISVVFLFLSISLSLASNYLGLLGYYFATIISIVIIFYFLQRKHSLNYRKYLRDIDIFDILKVNVMIIIQIFLLFYFPSSFWAILGVFFVVYFVLFRIELNKFIKSSYNLAKSIIKNE